jgi:DNA-binding transcriptional regulator GbsR (MarR family)
VLPKLPELAKLSEISETCGVERIYSPASIADIPAVSPSDFSNPPPTGAAPMSPLVRSFVSHFGEMGSRWGINRTVGQMYALIFVSREPLHADALSEQLEISRSNVSMGLKELQAWRLVRMRHIPGDRREYFEAPGDAWEIFRTLAEERRRREIEPTLSMLRNALLDEPTNDADRHAQTRMRDMHGLIELMTTWFDDVQRLDQQTLSHLMKMGSKVQRLLEFTGRVPAAPRKTSTPAIPPTGDR